jgi:hypothetical protein
VSAALAVLAGIAAADAVCGFALGSWSRGRDHAEAIALLGEVSLRDAALPSKMRRLLSEKDAAHYSPNLVTVDTARRLLRYAQALLDEADCF